MARSRPPTENPNFDFIWREWLAEADRSIRYRGALMQSTATQAITNDTDTVVTFAAAPYDTNNIADLSNNKFIVPKGVGLVRLRAQVVWVVDATGTRFMGVLAKASDGDDASADTRIAAMSGLCLGTTEIANINSFSKGHAQSIASAPIPVIEGDTFELEVRQNSGGNLNVTNVFETNHTRATWFEMELLG